MTEIPFIEQLGDALEAAVSSDSSRSSEARRRRVRLGGSRRGLVVALVGVALLAGAAGAATTLLGSSQRLADGHVACFFSASGTLSKSLVHGPDVIAPADGSSPTATCRQFYRANAHTGLDASTIGFVACRANASTVAVYVADGRAEQCSRLGDRPLPVTYAAAIARVHELQLRLAAVERSRDCPSVQGLARQTRDTLNAVGFVNWRIGLPPTNPTGWQRDGPAGTGGSCAALSLINGSNSLNTPLLIQPTRQTVRIVNAPPRHLAGLTYRASGPLYQKTHLHCFNARSVRALVNSTFARSPLRPRFATTAASGRASDKLYQRGCVSFAFAFVGDNNRFVDIWLNARTAPLLPAKQPYPSANQFRP